MIRIPTLAAAAPAALVLALALATVGPATVLAQPAPAAPADTDTDDFGTGLEFEPEAVYRGFPVLGTYRAFLPPAFDLSRSMPPVGSQGSQSSCVAWATSYGLRGYYENRRTGSADAPTFSPAFVYNQIKGRSSGCNVGTSISDALNLMKRVGTVPMEEFPYDPSSCSRLPGPDLASEARPFRISDWKRVDITRLDDIKGQIFAGNPVVFGMLVNQAFHRLRGDAVFRDTGRDGGGHAMVLVGYDDRKNAFKLFNSWSRSWGNQGFGWVDYETFQIRTRSAFTMQVPMGSAPEPETPVRPKPPKPVAPAVVAPPVAHLPVVAPKPVAPPPVADSAESRLNALMSDIPCSSLRAERGKGGELTVRGVVGKSADRDGLPALLRQETGGAAPRLDVAVLPWPQCEAHITFAPALEHAQGLALRLRQAAGTQPAGVRPVLTDGMPLVFEVTTPAFPSYLYVIYLQTGGEAVYVHTPAMDAGRPWPAGSRVSIGDGSGGAPALAIGEPFGDEMILAVAAPFPLTESELPTTMTEREFLSLFRKTLLGHGTRGLSEERAGRAAAAYAVLTTRAGRP